MTISPGYTIEQIREYVHEYYIQPYGTKGHWLREHGWSYDRIMRWQRLVFEGDIDQGLVPRDSSGMTVPPMKRTSYEKTRAKERAEQAVKVEKLEARIRELEETNAILGKAIGLLHTLNEHEPDDTPTTNGHSSS